MKTANRLVASTIALAVMLGVVENQKPVADGAQATAESNAENSKDNASESPTRVASGLQAYYDFSDDDGPVVKDRSGVGEPLDLRITNMKAVRRSKGALDVRGKTEIRTEKPAARLINAVRATGELTIEAWIQPTNTNQNGPARIVTLSGNTVDRNFTLGQDGDHYEVRLRSTNTSNNGIPATTSAAKTAQNKLTHIVSTRNRSGRAHIYVDGKQAADKAISGSTSNWNQSHRLAIANELTGDRPWLGTYRLVAIYNRALRPHEIQRNFKAGADVQGRPMLAAKAADDPAAELFENEIAPLISKHCLECHDSASKKGGLDLSRKTAALAGGDGGKVIFAGKASESPLYESVASDEMPKKRPPLSVLEKKLLKEWIDAGAAWSTDEIDPKAHKRDRRACAVWIRRLTIPEYIETVRSAVGVDVEKEAREILPRDLRADGFSNTAYNLNVDLKHVEAYARLAAIIVERMDVKSFAARFSNKRSLTDDAMRDLIEKMGRRLLRGPLEGREVDVFRGISTTVASAGGDFDEAVSFIIEAMLQSPRFLYRIENQQGDGTAWPVGQYELASRLSYIIQGGPPDEALMKAADAGELSDRAKVLGHVRRMLDDPRAVERSTRFVDEWLNLSRLDNLSPNSEKFPEWNKQLAADMRAETRAFFVDVAWKQNRPLSDLFNAQVTFLTPQLAKHYGLKPQDAETIPQPGPLANLPKSGARGLVALYTFEGAAGNLVRDTSGVGEPLNLKIENASAVNRGKAELNVKGKTLIASAGPANKLIASARKSNAVTLEVWITPGGLKQTGPARILTLSSGTGERNFTLGQDGDRFDVRFRTTKTDGNGIPSVASPPGAVKQRLTQVVYTRDSTGRAKLYIDGEQKAAGNIDGDLSNWKGGFRLGLANETTGDRPWLGTYHRVAIYDRALSPMELKSAAAPGLVRYDLSSVPERGGLVTQGAVLTVGGDEGSMVARGLFVLHDVLDGEVKDPPPCVDTTPVPTKPGLTQRDIALGRIANQACSNCHKRFEPLAFGLGKFDGLGTFHEKDKHGNKLRDDGEILFPGREKPVSYNSSAELMNLLADSDRVKRNITWKATQFAVGRPITARDAPVLERIHETTWKNGGTWRDLVTAIVTSDLVQTTRTEKSR